MRTMTLLSHHTLLRGASVREITLADIFLYRLASGSSVNPDNRPMVMVIEQRNSKTCKDARLHHSYAARHLEAELYVVGDTILWLHFIYDQVPQIFGVPIIPPLDVRRPELWYNKHLFFARYDKDQGLLPSSSQQRITRQLWTANKVFIKRNVHAARAGRAEELADQGTPRAEIAELGHWAIDKMTRSYITSIPVGVVMRKAGYSGARSDYFLGRNRLPPSADLEKTIAAHIFPGVEEQLGAAWAKDIEKIDTETIAKHRSPIPTQPAMKVEKELEEARAAIAARDAEISRLMEELKISEARRAPAPQAPSRPTTLEEEAAAAAKQAQLDADAHYEALVVNPWRKVETVAEAWRFWNCPTTTDRRHLCDRINEPGFIGRHSLLGKSSASAKRGEMRRMRRAMEAVRRFRSSDGEADTAAVIKKLDELAASGIVTFCDALKIIDADTLPIRTEGNLGIKGLSKGEKPKLTVAWGLVAAGYMTHKWGEDMFPTTWEEQKAVAAQTAAEQAAARPPPLPTKTSKRRKPG
ncbi:unnamed protein product [Closterium sp. NIES-65]|nr:unnamed protein product [Closterium sp. NIES-65]